MKDCSAKKTLGILVLLTVMQGSSSLYAAGTNIESGIYNDSVNFEDKFIKMDKNNTSEDKTYSFNKGGTLVGNDVYGNYVIRNESEHKLTINIGSELEEGVSDRYKFDLRHDRKNWGLGIVSINSNIDLNLTNTDFTFDNSINSEEHTIMISSSGEDEGEKSIVNITLDNSSIASNKGSIESKGNAELHITGNKNSSISTGSSIEASFGGKLTIEGLKKIEAGCISSDDDSSFSIKDVDEITITGTPHYRAAIFNGGIGTISTDNLAISVGNWGIANSGKLEIDSGKISINADNTGMYFGENGETAITSQNDIEINSNGCGIKAEAIYGHSSSEDIISTNGNIIINSKEDGINKTDGHILLQAKKNISIVSSDLDGINVSHIYNTENPNFKIEAIDGSINIEGKQIGADVSSDMDIKSSVDIEAKNDVKIIGDNTGVVFMKGGLKSEENLSSLNITSNDGKIEIYGGQEGFLLSVTSKADLNINSLNDSVYITSDGEAISVSKDPLSDITDSNLDGSILAKEDVFISGKDKGINIQSARTVGLDIESVSGDVYILGENNGIVLDSKTSYTGSSYNEIVQAGNIAQHDIDISAGGSVYIGDFNAGDNSGSIGICNTGRNILNIEASELVNIQGDIALKAEKETSNNIKGSTIILNGTDKGLYSEGVNTIVLGYDGSERKTDNVIINGDNIGMEIKANTHGMNDGSYSYADYLIDGENSTVIINAQNVGIYGNDYGIKISQDATSKDADESSDIYTTWKNSSVNINGSVNVIAQNGTAISVDGINKTNIVGNGNNYIAGKINGIDLYVNKAVDLTHSDITGTEYKERKAKEGLNKYVSANNGLSNAADMKYSDYYFAAQRVTDEMLETEYQKFINDSESDPEQVEFLKGYYDAGELKKGFLLMNDVCTEEECDMTVFNYLLTQVTVEDLYNQYISLGYIDRVSTINIDTTNNFTLDAGESSNTIVAGGKVLSADGVKDVNIIGKNNILMNISDGENEGSAVYAVNGAEVNVEATERNYLYGQKHAIYNDKSEVTLNSKAANIISGKMAVDNIGGTTNINADDIYLEGKEDGIRTGSGGIVNVNAANISKTDNSFKSITVASDLRSLTAATIDGSYSGKINIHTDSINLVGNRVKDTNQYTGGASEDDLKVQAVVFGYNGSIDLNADSINIVSNNTEAISNDENRIYAAVQSRGASDININGNSTIVSENGVALYATKLKQLGNIQLSDDKQSVINLADKDNEGNYLSHNIMGDIVAGKDSEITIGGKGNFVGAANGANAIEVLAANGGKVDLGLQDGVLIGRVDDYYQVKDANTSNDMGLVDTAFRNNKLYTDISTSGEITLNMNENSTWYNIGQSYVSNVNLNGGTINLGQDKGSSVNIGKLSGTGTFNMYLNSAVIDSDDYVASDMLYIQDVDLSSNTDGKFTVNAVGKDVLTYLDYGDKLRFATVGGENADKVNFVFNTVKDNGIKNVDFIVGHDEYDKAGETETNEKYNGGSTSELKPGNTYVDNEFGGSTASTFDTITDGATVTAGAGENYYITRDKESDNVNDVGKTIINMSRANYQNAVYLDRLNKRLGEARYIDGDEGMWVRLRHDRIGMKDEFRSMNTMYQLGYDKLDNKDNKGERHIGAAIDYMDGSTSYSNIYGEGETRRWGFWMYDTWLGNKGHYADYVAKFGHMHNEFDITSLNTGEKITGDYDNNVFSISAEYGRKKDIGNNWYIEPQAQLQLARVTGAEYKTSQDTDVYVDGINSLVGRVGFRLGKDVDERSTAYVKADVLHEFLGDQRIAASDVTGSLDKTYENKGTWYDVGFGFATAVGHNSYAYLDFEKSFGNDNDDTYQINAGVQWTF